MSGESAVGLLGLGVLVPAAGAAALVWLSRKLLRGDASSRYPAAAGFVGGFVIGYVLLADWEEWLPERHWQWLPYLALAAGIVAPVANAKGVSLAERWLVSLLLAAASAWFLVPTWSSLEPPRAFWLMALSGLLFLLAAGLDPLPQRIGSRPVLLSLSAASLVVTLMVGLCVSLTYALVAAAATASLAGVGLESLLLRRNDSNSRGPGATCSTMPGGGGSESEPMGADRQNGLSEDELAVRALLPVAAIVVGGAAFVGCIEPQRPLYGLLVLPAAPLGLWLSAAGPVKSRSGRSVLATQAAAVGLPLLAGAVQVFFAS